MTTILVLALLIVVLFVLSIAMGKEMKIEQTVLIQKPVNVVFDYLKMTKNQDHFSVWNMTDPEMKKDYVGVDGEVGFLYKWDSFKNKNVGAGEQEIIGIEAGKRIEYEIRFFRPMKNVANVKFLLSSEGSSATKVTWVFSGPTKFPMSLLKPIFQNMLGKDMSKGLSNLKIVLEKN